MWPDSAAGVEALHGAVDRLAPVEAHAGRSAVLRGGPLVAGLVTGVPGGADRGLRGGELGHFVDLGLSVDDHGLDVVGGHQRVELREVVEDGGAPERARRVGVIGVGGQLADHGVELEADVDAHHADLAGVVGPNVVAAAAIDAVERQAAAGRREGFAEIRVGRG